MLLGIYWNKSYYSVVTSIAPISITQGINRWCTKFRPYKLNWVKISPLRRRYTEQIVLSLQSVSFEKYLFLMLLL